MVSLSVFPQMTFDAENQLGDEEALSDPTVVELTFPMAMRGEKLVKKFELTSQISQKVSRYGWGGSELANWALCNDRTVARLDFPSRT